MWGGQRGVSFSLSARMATQRMAFYFCVFVYIFLGTMMTPAPRLNETKNELIIKIFLKKSKGKKGGGGRCVVSTLTFAFYDFIGG